VKGHLHSRGTQLGETQCCSYMLATAGPIFASSRLPEVVDFTSDLEWRVEACQGQTDVKNGSDGTFYAKYRSKCHMSVVALALAVREVYSIG
jgi:hypothetical protein